MALDYDTLLAANIPAKEQVYTERDTILYALGVGFGHDPLDERELRFVYERDLQAPPTYASTLAWTRFADVDVGYTYTKLVHSEQRMIIHQSLAPAGEVVSQLRVKDAVDRGSEKGALIYFERTLREKNSGALISTTTLTLLARADGGFGGPAGPVLEPHPIPERAADLVVEQRVSPRAALIYRLNGDVNPLHVDPAAARASGFDRPILHGLATYGVIGGVVLRSVCDFDSTRLKELDGRFSSPVFPGDTVVTELWIDGETVTLRAKSKETGATVFNNGRARVTSG